MFEIFGEEIPYWFLSIAVASGVIGTLIAELVYDPYFSEMIGWWLK